MAVQDSSHVKLLNLLQAIGVFFVHTAGMARDCAYFYIAWKCLSNIAQFNVYFTNF